MISFLHTSKVHIERFENLVRKFDKTIPIKHFVNEDLLSYAFKNGKVDTKSFDKEILTIKKENPTLIICTCSTYGEECNDTNDVKRIDFPIVDYLVQNYSKIGLVFTASSTASVSRNILQKVANHQQKKIKIINCDCSDAWVHFENNDINEYEKSIANKIKNMAASVDVIFLAQASMEGVKKHLSNLEQPVFSSPEFGIKSYLNK